MRGESIASRELSRHDEHRSARARRRTRRRTHTSRLPAGRSTRALSYRCKLRTIWRDRDSERRLHQLKLESRFAVFLRGIGIGDNSTSGEERRPGAVDERRPERDCELSSCPIDPPNRRSIPPAIEILVVMNKIQCPVARRATNSGSWMKPRYHVENG